MQMTYLITLAGADRPGIMEKIAASIAGHSGNWLDSRLAHLGSHFAGVVRFSAPSEAALQISRELEALADVGLQITVHEDKEGRPVPTPEAPRATIQLLGLDRPGIVSRITSALAAHHVNIEEFTSSTESAPMSGEPLFRASASLSFPNNHSLETIRKELDAIAAELDLEMDLA